MFQVERFNDVCKKIKSAGTFRGFPVLSKTDVYGIIADELLVSQETVRKWASKNSSGPRTKSMLEDLESIVGVGLWKAEKSYTEKQYSEISKKAIFDVYGFVNDYFTQLDCIDEECWVKTFARIESLRLGIPDEDYEKIVNYLHDNIEDMIYDEKTVFAELHTEKYGYYDEKGVFVIDDNKFTAFMGKYFEIIMKRHTDFQDFMISNYADIVRK